MKLMNNKGLTLTELVVCMAIIAVLATVSLPLARTSYKRSKEIELKRDLRQMRDAIDQYKKLVDEGRIAKEAAGTGYPKTLDVLVEGVNIVNGALPPGQQQLPQKLKFLRKVPVDPMTGNNEWGMRGNEDEPDSAIWNGKDVFDVYSKSDGEALDGTKYSDW